MKLTSITISKDYYSAKALWRGLVGFAGEAGSLSIPLTEEDVNAILVIAADRFSASQAKMAEDLAAVKVEMPLMLGAGETIEHDEIPF